MSPESLAGIIAAIPTPFDENEDLDLAALRENLKRWNRTRLSGYTVLGTTGEFVSLTTEEKKRVLAEARAVIPEDRTLLAGTGSESTREALALTRWAEAEGCDFAIVITPHYNRRSFSRRSLVEHYQRIAEESTIPVVVYHIPACTGLELPPDLVAEIAEHPNVAGIKDSSGDVFAIQEARRLCPEDFRILTGSARVLVAALVCGASGAILADACCVPELASDIYDAVSEGRLDEARALQERLAPLNGVLVGRHGIPGIKALLAAMGYHGGPPRRPLLSLSRDDVAELERCLENARKEPLPP